MVFKTSSTASCLPTAVSMIRPNTLFSTSTSLLRCGEEEEAVLDRISSRQPGGRNRRSSRGIYKHCFVLELNHDLYQIRQIQQLAIGAQKISYDLYPIEKQKSHLKLVRKVTSNLGCNGLHPHHPQIYSMTIPSCPRQCQCVSDEQSYHRSTPLQSSYSLMFLSKSFKNDRGQ